VVLLQRDRGEVIIKRIYRLPGEEVAIGYSNLATPGLKDYYEQESVKVGQISQIRYVVPQGYIVVLGDNPDVSEDSRFFGPAPISSIIGTVVDAPPPPPTTLQRRAPLNPANTF
jgi:signal peptidase I